MISRATTWASFVKLEHTLFSLPVMFGGAFLAAGGLPPGQVLLWITVAGAGARTLAMALNRLVDRQLDARNPRTASRELPSGRLTVREGWAIAAVGLVAYLIGCLQLPPLCLWLSPVPVVVFVGYPYLKRFTPLAHFGVGLALALAPLGGWIAVRGDVAGMQPALWLGLFTWLWVAGFDIIYATLDEKFDRDAGLHSLPGRLGRRNALRVSAAAHGVAMLALAALYAVALSGSVAAALLLAVGLALGFEQSLAHRVNLAFFHLNIVVGFLVLAVVVTGLAGI